MPTTIYKGVEEKFVLTIGVIPNTDKKNVNVLLARVIRFFSNKEVELIIEEKAAINLGYPQFAVDSLLKRNVDLVLTLGGDGTLLSACRVLAKKNIPVCGINIGRLGFLADIELAEIESKLQKIIEGEYQVEERLMIDAMIKRNGVMSYVGAAINDVVVTKGGFSRMIRLGLSVDDCLIANYQADGVIISTSTGSTGYSLSAGGPIVHPSLKVLLITPICPHTLNARPLIISDEEEARVNITATHHDIVLTIDGQVSHNLLSEDEVIVRKSALIARVIKFDDKNYYKTIRTKLWRGD